jgi:flavin-dependent dehydrogenase
VATYINSDVLVIGGGPAGTAAAITCARGGQSVILLEAETFPRHVPGETLHPGVESLLRRLGAAAVMESANFLRHAGVWIDRSGKPEFQAYGSDKNGPWLGYQAPRSEFDALLLEQARCCGVRILQPHRALRVLREGDRIAGAETTAGTVRARFTVDASGTSAWLARQLSLPFRRTSRKLVAFYGYMHGECPGREAAPCFTYRTDGWVWTARVRPNLFHWTRLFTIWPTLRREGPPPEFAGLELLGRPKGCDVTWRLLESCAGPGYFVAGNAASVTDPSSSHGVLRAMMSGMLAGHLVLRKKFRNESEPALRAEYRQFIRSSFDFDWSKLRGWLI